jgi:hypothetical protein
MELDNAINNFEEGIHKNLCKHQEFALCHDEDGAFYHARLAEEYAQVAEWLRELKRLRAQHEKMAKEEATQYVFDELLKYNLFRGVYDAENGNQSYMHGISAVMECIAAMISAECLDRFNEEFTKNLIESEGEGNGRGKS